MAQTTSGQKRWWPGARGRTRMWAVGIFLPLLLFLAPVPPCCPAAPSSEAENRVSSAANPWTHTFYFENDLFAGSDSNYTNGIKLTAISPDLSPNAVKRGKVPRKVLDFVHSLPFIRNAPDETSHKVEFAVGQNIYTPADISRNDLIVDDRPYGGWGYFATSFHRKSDHPGQRQMDTLELQFGLVGRYSFAEDAQKFIHELRGLQEPNGWYHQLDNEPGLVIAYERKWLFHPEDLERRLGVDAISHAGFALGNVFTYINAGLELRFGWNLPETFGVSIIRPAGSTRLTTSPQFSWYLFGAVNGRLVGRDIFLDGNTLAHSHSVERKITVADLAAGIAVNWRNVTVSLTENLRTEEFAEQDGTHSFGSLSVAFSFLY